MDQETIIAGNNGSMVYQVVSLLKTLEAFGMSRHQAKTLAVDGQPTGIYSFNTIKTYVSYNIRLVRWCAERYQLRRIPEMTSGMVAEYFDWLIYDKKASAWTVTTQRSALGKLNQALILHGFNPLVIPNPSVRRRLTDRQHVTIYTDDEVHRLINALSSPYQLMAQTQLTTGCRVVSLLRLRVQDIGARRLRIRGKGGKVQWRPIDPELHRALLRWTAVRPAGARVFSVSASAYRMALHRACIQAGVPVGSTHALRRTFARRRYENLRRQGLSDREARQVLARDLGHGAHRISVTYAYHGRESREKNS